MLKTIKDRKEAQSVRLSPKLLEGAQGLAKSYGAQGLASA